MATHRQSSIYWFDPEPTRGSEMRKVSPCIVVSPDEMNAQLRTVIVVPLTTSLRPWPFRTIVTVSDRQASAACDQLRTIDKNRLKTHIGDLRSADRERLYGLLQVILSE